jgi:hypothetical protein
MEVLLTLHMRPQELQPIGIDWAPFPGASDETIVDSEWFVESGPAKLGKGQHAPSYTSGSTTAWVYAVPPGSRSILCNVITTTAANSRYSARVEILGV